MKVALGVIVSAIVFTAVIVVTVFACCYWAGIPNDTRTVVQGHCVLIQRQALPFSAWDTTGNSCT